MHVMMMMMMGGRTAAAAIATAVVSRALSLSLYKYINTCKLPSSRPHHRQKGEKETEKNYYALFFPLLILKSSTTSAARLYI
jgi:hypothetical protein